MRRWGGGERERVKEMGAREKKREGEREQVSPGCDNMKTS